MEDPKLKTDLKLLKGQNWVVTGQFSLFTRSEWEIGLRELGAIVTKKVSKDTNYVLQGYGTEYGSKVLGAKELEIRLVTEFELHGKINDPRQHERWPRVIHFY